MSWDHIPAMLKLGVSMFLVPTPADVYQATQVTARVNVEVSFRSISESVKLEGC